VTSAKVLVAAHDAGGANQILHKFKTDSSVKFILTGPAQKIASGLGIKFESSLSNTDISSFDRVAVSSNSSKELSDLILSKAQELQIETYGFLDNWVNYSKRWENTPSRIVVSDLHALSGAMLSFHKFPVLASNDYLSAIRTGYNLQPNTGLRHPLFILQPLGIADAHRNRKCICSSLTKIKNHFQTDTVIVRSHYDGLPQECAESLDKYSDLKLLHSSPDNSLESDLARASLVVGYDSYALYIAKKLGKKVFTLQERRRSWFAPKYPYLN
jgi:hypothetical protein